MMMCIVILNYYDWLFIFDSLGMSEWIMDVLLRV